MRRFVPVLAFLTLAPAACRHDLTLCHDENDGPACRDSALDQSTTETTSADSTSIDDGAVDSEPDTAADTLDGSLDDTSIDGPQDASADATVTDTGLVDTSMADTYVADTYVADTYVADTYVADTYVADTYVADTYVADTYVADTYVADTYVADTYVPDTTVVDSGPADTGPSCSLGSYSCGGVGGNSLYRCGDAGLSLVVACPAGTCNAGLGRCTACTPGSYSCTGSARQQCDSYGATLATVATCVTPELCAASTGASCTSPVCSSSHRACGGLASWSLQTCNAGRTAFVDTECVVDCLDSQCLTVVSLQGGGANICALLSNGMVRCGLESPSTTIGSITTAVQIAVGADWVGARLADGTVRLWNGSGGTGGGPEVPGSAVPVAGITGVEHLAVGASYACVRLAGGVVKCWGTNGSGQLGNGTTTDFMAPPTLATAGLTATGTVTLGVESSYAVTASGAVAWGFNLSGMLGVGSLTNRLVPTAGFGSVVSFAAGDQHACGLSSSGTVTCAGSNIEGQLGDGSHTDHSSPAPILGLDGLVAQIAAAGMHTCALLKDGTVRCWGLNVSGELGDGTTTQRTYPVAVPGLTGVKQIAAYAARTCALLNDSVTLKCWGNGVTTPTTKPWH